KIIIDIPNFTAIPEGKMPKVFEPARIELPIGEFTPRSESFVEGAKVWLVSKKYVVKEDPDYNVEVFFRITENRGSDFQTAARPADYFHVQDHPIIYSGPIADTKKIFKGGDIEFKAGREWKSALGGFNVNMKANVNIGTVNVYIN